MTSDKCGLLQLGCGKSFHGETRHGMRTQVHEKRVCLLLTGASACLLANGYFKCFQFLECTSSTAFFIQIPNSQVLLCIKLITPRSCSPLQFLTPRSSSALKLPNPRFYYALKLKLDAVNSISLISIFINIEGVCF